MKARQVTWSLVGLLSLVVAPARADLQFLDQARSVSAENSEGASASAVAPDFAPFAASARVSWEYAGSDLPPGAGTQRYSANARQDSVLSVQEITAQGYADDVEPFYHYVDFSQESLSDFHVAFATDAPAMFLLSGELRAWGDYGGTDYGTYRARVELSNGAGAVFSTVAQAGGPPPFESVIDIQEILTLEGGVYTLDLSASAEGCGGPYDPGVWGDGIVPGCGGSGGARYDVRLAVIPAPAVLPLALCGLGAVAFLKRRKILR